MKSPNPQATPCQGLGLTREHSQLLDLSSGTLSLVNMSILQPTSTVLKRHFKTYYLNIYFK